MRPCPPVSLLRQFIVRHVYYVVGHFEQHSEPAMFATLLACRPAQGVQHLLNAGGVMVAVEAEAGCPSLDHLNFLGALGCVWIPDRLGLIRQSLCMPAL